MINIEASESSFGHDTDEVFKNLTGKYKVKSASDIILNDFDVSKVVAQFIPRPKEPISKKDKLPLKSLNSVLKEAGGEFIIHNSILKSESFYFITDKNEQGQGSLNYDTTSKLMNGALELKGLYDNTNKPKGLKLLFDNPNKAKVQFKLKKP